MNIITKLPKRWIEENEDYKWYYFIKNNEIYYHTYNKDLNKFVSKNVKRYHSIKKYLYNINNPNDSWSKKIRPIIIKALKEEEFNEMIRSL